MHGLKAVPFKDEMHAKGIQASARTDISKQA